MKRIYITTIGNFATDKEPYFEENKLMIETTLETLDDGKKIYKCKEKICIDLNEVKILAIKEFHDLEELPQTIQTIQEDTIKLKQEIEERNERLESLNKASQDSDFQQYLFHKNEMKKFETIYNAK